MYLPLPAEVVLRSCTHRHATRSNLSLMSICPGDESCECYELNMPNSWQAAHGYGLQAAAKKNQLAHDGASRWSAFPEEASDFFQVHDTSPPSWSEVC